MTNQEAEVSPDKRNRKEIIAENLRKIAERREKGEISPEDFQREAISYVNEIERRALAWHDLLGPEGIEAIVVSQEELEYFDCIRFVSPKGELRVIFAEDTGYDPEDMRVIFPEELGKVRPEISQMIDTARKILQGKYGTSPPDRNSFDPRKVFSRPILDLNDKSLTLVELTFLQDWIKQHLCGTPENAPVKQKLVSKDGKTTVIIFNVPLGQENDIWYLSRWQNQGEEPSFVFWPEKAYKRQAGEYIEAEA